MEEHSRMMTHEQFLEVLVEDSRCETSAMELGFMSRRRAPFAEDNARRKKPAFPICSSSAAEEGSGKRVKAETRVNLSLFPPPGRVRCSPVAES